MPAAPPVNVPKYPNVPNAPGVPSVLRNFNLASNNATILTSDAVQVLRMLGLLGSPVWGIFDTYGNPVIIGDNVIGLDLRKEYQVPEYPIEGGSFESYNKVELPYEARMTFSCGGQQSFIATFLSGGYLGQLITQSSPSASNRGAFLSSIAQAAASTNLYAAVSPEIAYVHANIVHYDYHRVARASSTLIVVDIWLKEIRIPTVARITTTQTPDGAQETNGGNVQSQKPGSNVPPTKGSQPMLNIRVPPGFGTPGFTNPVLGPNLNDGLPSIPQPLQLPNGTTVPTGAALPQAQ